MSLHFVQVVFVVIHSLHLGSQGAQAAGDPTDKVPGGHIPTH